jgi:periplasmic copper chaperone A
MTKSIRAALALAIAAALPMACSEAPEQAEGAPDAPDGITVANGRLMLPAVAGNPGAVYFDVENSSDRNMIIRAVSVAGAGSAEMHNKDMQMVLQSAVPPGGSTKFEPGGHHIMAMSLADTVTAGGEAEVTLTFVGGDKVSFPAEVRAAGDER